MDEFWTDFQSDLRKNDVPGICRKTRFPLVTDLSQMEEFADVETRQGFIRHFRTVFPDSAVQTLLKAPSLGTINKTDSSGGQVQAWSIHHNERDGISGTESSFIYVFSRCADGKIRLTAVHLAG